MTINIIWFLPLGLSIGSVIYFFTTEMSMGWKLGALVALVASLATQWIPALYLHFIIPLVVQVLLSFWGMIHWKLNR